MEELKVLMDRKTVRDYSSKEVTREVKDAILNAVLRAPSAGNMMMYTVIEVSDQEIKNRLIKTCDNQPLIGKAPFVLLFLADYQRWIDYLDASGVEEYNRKNNLKTYKPKEGDFMIAVSDALIAAETSVIAADMLGLGSCYIGDIMENYETHKEMFSLPQYTFPIAMVCFGYPTEQQKNRKQPKRYPKEMIVHENSYRTISKEEFKKMEGERHAGEKQIYLPGCENEAIHMYKRKITSDFVAERNRSVKEAFKVWFSENNL